MGANIDFAGTGKFAVLAAIAVLSWGVAARSQGSGQPNSALAGSTDKGFAIESEILTYTAMDSESAAVACGIARNVGAADSNCAARTVTGAQPGIVVVASGSSALQEFQLWRTDISTMDMLTLRANRYCGQTRGPLSMLDSLTSMIPEGQAISFAQSLLTTTLETSPIEGDILDQTLVDAVAGHLRGLGVPVVIPDTYMPRSLMALDQAHSPFLQRFVALVKARQCVITKPAPKADDDSKDSDDSKPAEKSTSKEKPAAAAAQCSAKPPSAAEAQNELDKQAIAAAIDAFLKSLNGLEAPPPKDDSDSETKTPPPGITHLSAVLRADGLAVQLGAGDPDTSGSSAWYVLWLKALESGGTLLKSGNAILGTKTSYSGGSIGTYALFHLDGNLECSGTFFNYTGPWQTPSISKTLQSGKPVPEGKLSGGCNPMTK